MRVNDLTTALALLAAIAAPLSATAVFAQMPAAPPAAEVAIADYHLGSGDKLRITVFGEDNLTGEYTVAANGIVAFPLIGTIQAAGMTIAQVQDSIRTRLSDGYLKDPRVAIEVLEYRTFYILGEVNKPGEYPYRKDLTVEQAVATAGGYTYRANRKRFVIAHAEAQAESRLTFKESARLRVVPGDTVRILERFF